MPARINQPLGHIASGLDLAFDPEQERVISPQKRDGLHYCEAATKGSGQPLSHIFLIGRSVSDRI